MEQTFIQFYARRQFQNVETSVCAESDGLSISEKALFEIHEYLHVHDYVSEDNRYDTSRCPAWHKKHFLTCKSIRIAIKINNLLKYAVGTACYNTSLSKGILIGPKMGKKARPKPADGALENFLEHHFKVASWGTYVYTHIRKCMLQGVLYEIGDDVVVKPNDLEHVPMKAKISQFIYIWYKREMHVFFGATYYYIYREMTADGQRKLRKTIVRKGTDYVESIT